MFSKDRIVDLTPQPVETLSKSFPRYLNIVDYDMIMDPLEKMRDKKVIIFGDSYRTEEILKILSLLKISPYKLVCNDDLGIRLFSSIVDCETMNSYLSPVNNNHEKEFVIIGDSDDWYTLLEKLDCPTFEKIEVTTTFAFYRSMLHHRTEVYQEINDYLDVESRNNIRQHDSQEIVDSKNILLKQLPKSQVIVYQPGKVGSMSVNYSLISAGCKSLHVHSFYDFDWDKEFSKRDQERIMHQFTNTKIKVITMVRNPIPRDVSMFMQLFQEDAIPRHRCTMEWIIDENGNEVVVDKNYLVDPDLAVACQKFISHQTEYQFGWFDREIKRTFGVNIYQYPFDKEKGYTIIKDGNVEILLMKCEMIDSLENVIKEFCELSHFKLVRTNDGGQKENNFIYKLLKQRIHLSQDYVNSYLSNDKALHFYTKEEIIEGAKKVDKNF